MGENLKIRGVYCLNLGIKRRIKNIHWIYFPEEKFPFYRIGFQSNFSPFVAPKNRTSLYIEVSYNKVIPRNIKQKILESLKEIGIKKEDIDTELELLLPYAYVVYDKERERVLPEIFDFLKRNKIYTTGRFGNWEYSSMQESVINAKKLAKNL